MNLNKPYEIGSHFDLNFAELGDYAYTFSGRAAIELALNDILNSQNAVSVYMPSYCCSSMLQPFIKKGIDIVYYDVLYEPDKGIVQKIDTSVNCDIFFFMSYFGLEVFSLDYEIELFSKRGVIVIEDITHSFLSDDGFSKNVDYSIASIRKWLPIASGGYIIKHRGSLVKKPLINSDDLVTEKIQAMKEKYYYLNGEATSKESFLEKFSLAEEKFSQIDSSYRIDSLSLRIINSIDIDKIKNQRRKNGKILYKGLQGFNLIKPLIPNPDFDKLCPLFIPIVVGKGYRDDLREYLIANSVYCPVHWSNDADKRESIQREELSLICDQRYNEEDMEYILNLIRDWQERKER